MSLTAFATVASGLLGGHSASKLAPSYGVAFRFHLEMDGIKTGWQSCSGLKVEYKTQEIKAGGAYLSQRYLPGETSFSRVVLKRAICKTDSDELRTWLQKRATGWMERPDPDQGSSASITLYDSDGDPVLTWHLRGARPASWSGPELDANSSKVALETLELVHEGFDVSIGKESYSGNNKSFEPQQMTLSRGADKVAFLYPPTAIQLSHSSQPTQSLHSRSVTGQSTQAHESPAPPVTQEVEENAADTTTLAMGDLVLAGEKTASHVRLLMEWAKANGQATNRNSNNLPILHLKWGQGLPGLRVVVKSLSVSYTRFKSNGIPIQAKVTLTLIPQPDPPKRGNPTSGGLPGRASHVLVSTDSLSGLAQASYQQPSRWRAIAEANGMDDPLRLRPGTICYLPAESELG